MKRFIQAAIFASFFQVTSYAWSPFRPPIEDRLKEAVAIVEGRFINAKETKDAPHANLPQFHVSKILYKKGKIPKNIHVLDDFDAKELFGGEVYIGKGNFPYGEEMILIIYEFKHSKSLSYFKLGYNDRIGDDEIEKAKKEIKKLKRKKWMHIMMHVVTAYRFRAPSKSTST